MNFLQNILGGGQEDERSYRDFVNRYEQGLPHEGYSDQEVYDRYQQVSRQVPPDVYQQSAYESFNRMSPQERRQFGQYMQQQVRQQNYDFPDFNGDGIDDRLQDPQYLAQATSRMHQQQPDMLGQLLGGAGSMLGGGGGGNALGNPLVKGAMAGIAALAVKKMMSGGQQQQGYGNIRPASQDPYGDPADQGYGNIRPASEDPYGDPADRGY